MKHLEVRDAISIPHPYQLGLATLVDSQVCYSPAMKRILTCILRVPFCLLIWSFSSTSTRSQSLRFDDFASQIDHELKPMKPHLVAVTDFRINGDSSNVLGHYLALLVSQSLIDASNRHYKVANHKSFDDDLAKLHITDVLGSDSAHPSISPSIRADVLLTGTIDPRKQPLPLARHSCLGLYERISSLFDRAFPCQ